MIHVVLGTKAQLVKMAPLMNKMQIRGVAYRFIFTGQHKETMDALRGNFNIKSPDVTLYHGKDITSVVAMFFWMARLCFISFFKRKNIFGDSSARGDIVLVHGDTFSTILGALMGKLAGAKVGHVESGLRSFNLFHPFPEELTRILTFIFSDYYFCPGDWAVENLSRFSGKKINTIYNTLIDSLAFTAIKREADSSFIPSDPYCVVTTHRFENVYSKKIFARNIDLIENIASNFKSIFILHPLTEKKLREFDLYSRLESNVNIEFRPRYDYFDFIRLVRASEFLVTDGGSNQEEAFYMGKPCLLLRKTSERQEGIDFNVVVSDYDLVAVEEFVKGYTKYRQNPVVPSESPSDIIINNVLAFA